MSWGAPRSFPRAILHIDGDSFFASCEIAKDPALRGKPVITGKERGIVSACTYEAKAAGVKRGMKLYDARKVCPSAVILPSDYETYSIFSARMYAIVRRYTPDVEEYSIDECFADLTGMRRSNRLSYPGMAAAIREELSRELGMTFSIGLSATKTLAKIGSKWKKPDGLTVIPLHEARVFLAQLPIGSVWGIGPNTTAFLAKHSIRTAAEFASRSESWVRSTLSVPFHVIWQELNGEMANPLDTEGRQGYQSISKTKTFTPPSRDPAFIYSQLSKNVENACIKLRRWDLSTPLVSVFLKTQDFRYHSAEVPLPHLTSVPVDILAAVRPVFSRIFRDGTEYRATGITCAKLVDGSSVQLDLFGSVSRSERIKEVFESVDKVSEKYGKHSVFLGSSFLAMTHGAHLGERGDLPKRTRELFKGESARRHVGLPFLGEVA